MGAIDSIGDDLQKCANNPSKACQYKPTSPFSITSIIYLLVVCFMVGGVYFSYKTDIEYVKKDVEYTKSKTEMLQREMNQTRESFTRLDERLAGLQRELTEIKMLLRQAIESRHKE